MTRSLARLAGGATVLALAAAGLVLPKSADYMDKPVKEWREGPVRYIITKSEDNEYKSLRTKEERARFIETFWQRRDETPETPGNEFRAAFWRRVRDANRLYEEQTPREGWRTDMGKMHILLGPPDDITRDLVAQGSRGTVVWSYRSTEKPGFGPNVVLAFAQDVTGEFRLTAEPSKEADPKQGMPMAYQPPMGTAALGKAQAALAEEFAAQAFNLTDPLIRMAGGPASAPTLALLTQFAKLQQPPREWEIRETVTTQEFFGAVPVRARADFYKTTGSRTLVVLTVGMASTAVHFTTRGGRELPDVVVYGRILDLTGNDLLLSLEQDGDFSPAPENLDAGLDDELIFQAQALLEPGSYKAALTVLDRIGGRAGSYTTSLTVPDFNEAGLILSSVALAASIGAGEESGGGPRPYAIGNLRVLPRLGQSYGNEDDLAFYYQVYGAGEDPEKGTVNLDVDYGFYTMEAEGAVDLGHVTFAGQANAAHGYSLSLKEWPAGPYMLRVQVTDRVTDATASRDLLFEIR